MEAYFLNKALHSSVNHWKLLQLLSNALYQTNELDATNFSNISIYLFLLRLEI